MYKGASRFLQSLKGFDFSRPSKLGKQEAATALDAEKMPLRAKWYDTVSKAVVAGAKRPPKSLPDELRIEIYQMGMKRWLKRYAFIQPQCAHSDALKKK